MHPIHCLTATQIAKYACLLVTRKLEYIFKECAVKQAQNNLFCLLSYRCTDNVKMLRKRENTQEKNVASV